MIGVIDTVGIVSVTCYIISVLNTIEWGTTNACVLMLGRLD